MNNSFLHFSNRAGSKAGHHLGYTLGVDVYLVKPFELKDLEMAVQSRLKRIRDIKAVS
jgi:DNA-binding response OmpR family regulator